MNANRKLDPMVLDGTSLFPLPLEFIFSEFMVGNAVIDIQTSGRSHYLLTFVVTSYRSDSLKNRGRLPDCKIPSSVRISR